MKLKDRVLQILKEKKEYISGEGLAEACKVSRNAIWLAVTELRKEGYCIDSQKKVGYLLQTDFSPLTEREIRQYLRQNTENTAKNLPNFHFKLFDSINSTNTYVKENADKLPNWTVVLAEEQTAGRGRFERNFASPKFAGVYMSILLRPNVQLQFLTRITACAAVAVCQAIESITDKKPAIKWVNDIFIDGKKAVGILTESVLQVELAALDFVVVGIGVNFHKKAIAESLNGIATALFDSENFTNAMRAKFVAYFLEAFYSELDGLQENRCFKAYRDRLFIIEQKVQVVLPNSTFVATVKDVNENYNLIVQLEDGREQILTAGEVSLRL